MLTLTGLPIVGLRINACRQLRQIQAQPLSISHKRLIGRTFNPLEINADAFTCNRPEKLIGEGDMLRMITVTVDHRRMAEPY
jgi:hypothetical protein